MRIGSGALDGVKYIQLEPRCDNRGYFKRTYDIEIFKRNHIDNVWVQENHSLSTESGVLRGLHFQFPPFSEAKLVRCIKGRIFDVFLDLRLKSPTFGNWESIELSEDNNQVVFIPRGFAHGFCTLEPNSEVLYKVDNFYNPEYECGVAWNDKELGIDWPCSEPQLSEKDRNNISFSTFKTKYGAIG